MNAAIETITLEQRIERERQALAKYLKTVLSPMASVSSSLGVILINSISYLRCRLPMQVTASWCMPSVVMAVS